FTRHPRRRSVGRERNINVVPVGVTALGPAGRPGILAVARLPSSWKRRSLLIASGHTDAARNDVRPRSAEGKPAWAASGARMRTARKTVTATPFTVSIIMVA